MADGRDGAIAYWRSEGQRIEIKYCGAHRLHREGSWEENSDGTYEFVPNGDEWVFTGTDYNRVWMRSTDEISEDSILRNMRGDRWERVLPGEGGTGFLLRKIAEGSYEVAEYRFR